MADVDLSDSFSGVADNLTVSTDEYTVFHTSAFDVSGRFTLSVPSITACTDPISVITPIRLAIPFDLISDDLLIDASPTITINPELSLITPNLGYDIGRGDLHPEFNCYAPSLLVKALPLVPDIKTVEFGAFKFSHAERENPDQITPETNERFARWGIPEPQIYTRKISIVAESNQATEYYQLQTLFGVRRSLSVYGYAFADAYISNLSELQRKPGLGRWVWHVEFIQHVFESKDRVMLDGWNVPTVITVSDEQKQPIVSDGYAERGISEPIGFSVSRSIEFIDYHGECTSQLENRVGKSFSVTINGVTSNKYRITNISSSAPKGGGLVKIFTVDLQRYQFNTNDSVKFGTVNLSNPTFPNAHDITPEYSVDMGVGFGSLNPIPNIVRRFAVECITTNHYEFEMMVGYIGTKQTLIINGKSYVLAFISLLSALQPRGGGNIWKYTIEFSQKSGVKPAVIKFDGVSLPNAVISSESIEILQTRTTMHSGAIVADLGAIPSKRFSVSCMSNSKSGYNSLYSKLGQKKTLVVDGETITKAYISDLQAARVIGDGADRLYSWDVSFEQETA